LITRYNLSDKVGAQEDLGKEGEKKGWSQNKGERQALMQRRKEEAKVKAEGSLAKPGV
jgi:hypothetical protein